MLKYRLILLSIWLSWSALGQTSLIQDSDGKSSIVIPKATTLNFNFADSKIETAARILKLNKKEDAPFSLSLAGYLKSENGIGSVFNGKGFSPEGNLGLTVLKFCPQAEEKGDALNWWYANLSHTFGNQKLYDSLGTFASLIKKQRVASPTITVGFNRRNQKQLAFGVAAQGIFMSNNYEDLDDYVISQQIVRYNSDSSQSYLITTDEKNVKGKLKEYKKDFNELNIVGDFLYWPRLLNGQIVLAAHLKGNFREIDKPSCSGTVGIYLTKANDKEKSDPTAIVGGIVFETQDFFRKRSDDSFKARSVINLVVGYNFKY